MTERDALLRAVCENPDDDTPRLVYADWLQENGEEERAEFIRVQVLMARTKARADEDWPSWQRLCAREQELLQAHDEDWWRELPDAPGYRLGRLFNRGFIEVLFVTDWAAFLRDVEVIFRSAPIWVCQIEGPLPITSPETLNCLSRFRSLGLSHATLSDADLRALITASLPLLEGLVLMRPSDQALCRSLEERFGDRLHYYFI